MPYCSERSAQRTLDPRRRHCCLLRSRILIPLLKTQLLELTSPELLEQGYCPRIVREQVELGIAVPDDRNGAVVNPVVDPVVKLPPTRCASSERVRSFRSRGNDGWRLTSRLDRARADHELSAGSIVRAQRCSADRFQGKNGVLSAGAQPPLSAQLCRNHVSHFRTFSRPSVTVANSVNSIAASRPLHKAPEP